jgi:hypothetical protein
LVKPTPHSTRAIPQLQHPLLPRRSKSVERLVSFSTLGAKKFQPKSLIVHVLVTKPVRQKTGLLPTPSAMN